jgi:hypothetical protein
MKTGINVINKEFIVNNNVVVCLITAKTSYPYGAIKIIDTLYKEAPLTCIKVKGISRCSKEDVFDIEYGKKLAEARAMKEVFKRFNAYYEHVIYDRIDEFLNFIARRQYATSKAIESEENHIKWLKK